MRKIITLGREFGSGGRELGKRLADYLGINYFDSEIAETLCRQTNLGKDYVDGKLERGVAPCAASYANSFSRISAASNSAMLIAKQHKIIKEFANKGDCLFVGRGADAALAEFSPFKIFVYAELSAKIARCKSRMTDGKVLTDKEIEKQIKSIDRGRRSVHGLYSSYAWGDKSAYELCINTTHLEVEKIVPAVALIIDGYFESLRQ